jgi:hypothetical protein
VNPLHVSGCRLQVFPNPAHGSSEVKYQIAKSKSVLIQVYNIHGAVVCTLLNADQSSGEHSVCFDTSGLPAGIYLIRLQAGYDLVTQTLILMQ